ncbi:MAG: hypothetical protein MUC89_03585 [Acetobacteraceae bacterium]|nr:hypothetical protein [Acetobacteraceae bacterium]
MNRSTRLAAAVLAATLAAAPAFAQAPAAGTDGARAERSRSGEQRPERRDQAALAARVSAADAIRAVEAAGYRGVTELEWERTGWEVKAQNAEGARVKLMVDGTTGAVTQASRR